MPSTATDRLQGLTTSVAIKPACRAVSTTNITLAGLQAVGSVTVIEDDRVLVTGQTDQPDNGIYNASSGSWVRAKDFDGNRDVVQGTLVPVVNGASGANLYEVTAANPIVIGTSNITFSLRYGANTRYDQTPAEIAVGVTPTDYAFGSYPYNVARVGLNPNSAGSASANTAALQALFDPTETGIQGQVIFPNTTGADIYDFNGIIQIRPGIDIDLNGCTLRFSKTYAAADDTMGFLTFIRDVSVKNGAIEIDYDGTGGVNAGAAMRIGSRPGYKFGSFASGIEEEDLSTPMGHIRLENLRITSNNPAIAAPIVAIGGLRNFVVENLSIDCQGAHAHGIYYEFGFWHYEATVANIKSSHANGLVFRNIRIENLDTTAGSGAGISLIGCGAALVENLHVDTAFSVFEFRPGEALFYNVGTPDLGVVKRCVTLRNITGRGITSVGLQLKGAEASSGGYLASAGLTESQQVDLMRFSVDGFCIAAEGAGIQVSGPCDIRNGTVNGAASSGQIIITDECTRFDFDNVEVRNSTGIGIRASFGGGIFATPRNKIGSIRNCQIAGNAVIGIALDRCENVLIENNRIGYSLGHDGVAETTQTIGVSLNSQAFGVRCIGNSTSLAAGAAAYNSANSTADAGNIIQGERVTRTVQGSGHFVTDFQSASAQAITNSSTISIEGLRTVRCTAAAACTGVILQAGYAQGQQVTVVNESAGANTITFAASGTSHVADGTGDVIAGLTAATFVYDTGTSRWYRIA